jgi:hypothetical protein
MLIPVLAFGVIFALLAASSARAEGVNLSWDDCGNAGTLAKGFDCASNSGPPFTIVASFIPPRGITAFQAMEAELHIRTSSPSTDCLHGPIDPLPDWWKHGVGECRGKKGLKVSFDFTSGPSSCIDVFGGQAVGGFAYDVDFPYPGPARLRVAAGIAADHARSLSSSQEYYAFKVIISRAKSAVEGSCAGCQTAVCMRLNSIQLYQAPHLMNDPEISTYVSRNYILWGSGYTPTQNSTWGAIKSLYR